MKKDGAKCDRPETGRNLHEERSGLSDGVRIKPTIERADSVNK